MASNHSESDENPKMLRPLLSRVLSTDTDSSDDKSAAPADSSSLTAAFELIASTLSSSSQYTGLCPLLLDCLDKAVFLDPMPASAPESLSGPAVDNAGSIDHPDVDPDDDSTGPVAERRTYKQLSESAEVTYNAMAEQLSWLERSKAAIDEKRETSLNMLRAAIYRNARAVKMRTFQAWRGLSRCTAYNRTIVAFMLRTDAGGGALRAAMITWKSFTFSRQLLRSVATVDKLKEAIDELEAKRKHISQENERVEAQLAGMNKEIDKRRAHASATEERLNDAFELLRHNQENWTRLNAGAWLQAYDTTVMTSLRGCFIDLSRLALRRSCCDEAATVHGPAVNLCVLITTDEWERAVAASSAAMAATNAAAAAFSDAARAAALASPSVASPSVSSLPTSPAKPSARGICSAESTRAPPIPAADGLTDLGERVLAVLKALPIDILLLRWVNYQLLAHNDRIPSNEKRTVLNFGTDFADGVVWGQLTHCLSRTTHTDARRNCTRTPTCTTPLPTCPPVFLNRDPLGRVAEALERLHRWGAPVACVSPALIVAAAAPDCNMALVGYLMATLPGTLTLSKPVAQAAVDMFPTSGLLWSPGDRHVSHNQGRLSAREQENETPDSHLHVRTQAHSGGLSGAGFGGAAAVSATPSHAHLHTHSPERSPERSPMRRRMMEAGELTRHPLAHLPPYEFVWEREETSSADCLPTPQNAFDATLHTLTCSSLQLQHAGCELTPSEFDVSASTDTTQVHVDTEDPLLLTPVAWKRVNTMLTCLQDNWKDGYRQIVASPAWACEEVMSAFPAAVQAVRVVLNQALSARAEQSRMWIVLRAHVEAVLWTVLRQRVEVSQFVLLDRRETALTTAFTSLANPAPLRLLKQRDLIIDIRTVEPVLRKHTSLLRGLFPPPSTSVNGTSSWRMLWPSFLATLTRWGVVTDEGDSGSKPVEAHTTRALEAATQLTLSQCRAVYMRASMPTPPPNSLHRAQSHKSMSAAAAATAHARGSDVLHTSTPQYPLTPPDLVDALLRVCATLARNAKETLTTVQDRRMLIKTSNAQRVCVALADEYSKAQATLSSWAPDHAAAVEVQKVEQALLREQAQARAQAQAQGHRQGQSELSIADVSSSTCGLLCTGRIVECVLQMMALTEPNPVPEAAAAGAQWTVTSSGMQPLPRASAAPVADTAGTSAVTDTFVMSEQELALMPALSRILFLAARGTSSLSSPTRTRESNMQVQHLLRFIARNPQLELGERISGEELLEVIYSSRTGANVLPAFTAQKWDKALLALANQSVGAVAVECSEAKVVFAKAQAPTQLLRKSTENGFLRDALFGRGQITFLEAVKVLSALGHYANPDPFAPSATKSLQFLELVATSAA